MRLILCPREIARLITKPGENPNKIIFQDHFGDVPAASNEEAEASILKNANGTFMARKTEDGPSATQAFERSDSMSAAIEERKTDETQMTAALGQMSI